MSNRERKEKEKEFKQHIIIDAAKIIFARDGYKHSKIEDIAKESGFAKGSVYNYFKSKKEIMEAILIEIITIKNQEFVTIIDQDITTKEKIEKIISIHYDTVIDPSSSILSKYFSDIKELLIFLLEAIPSLQETENQVVKMISNLIISLHEIHPVECACELDPYTLARLFISYGRGIMMEVMTSRLFCDEDDIERIENDNKKLIEQHIEFLLYNLEHVHINNLRRS